MVVDDLVGAELAYMVVIGCAGGGDHLGTEVLGELDGKSAHATGAALDEDGLPGLEL